MDLSGPAFSPTSSTHGLVTLDTPSAYNAASSASSLAPSTPSATSPQYTHLSSSPAGTDLDGGQSTDAVLSAQVYTILANHKGDRPVEVVPQRTRKEAVTERQIEQESAAMAPALAAPPIPDVDPETTPAATTSASTLPAIEEEVDMGGPLDDLANWEETLMAEANSAATQPPSASSSSANTSPSSSERPATQAPPPDPSTLLPAILPYSATASLSYQPARTPASSVPPSSPAPAEPWPAPPALAAGVSEDVRPLPPHIIDLSQSLLVAAQCAQTPYRLNVQLGRAEPGAFNGLTSATADIDDGAMVSLVSRRFWDTNKSILGPLTSTPRRARMADHRTVAFDGELQLTIYTEGVPTLVQAFVMAGEWDVILGKPWLHENRLDHNYAFDWLYMFPPAPGTPPVVFLPNAARPPTAALDPIAALQALLTLKTGAPWPSPSQPPTPMAPTAVRWVEAIASQWSDVAQIEEYARVSDLPPTTLWVAPVGAATDVRTVTVTPPAPLPPDRLARREKWQPYHLFGAPSPSKARADAVVELIRFGSQLSNEQRQSLVDLVHKYQHVFGLSAEEVASNKLVKFDIVLKEGAHCPQRAPRDPGLSPTDREWLHQYCRSLLDAGILRPVAPSNVKWISDIKIVPKGKGAYASTNLEVLRDMANHGLREAQLPYDPKRQPPPDLGEAEWVPTKGLRLVHNYIPLNRATADVSKFPVGAMEQKVASLAGREFYSSFDMLMGYFAIEATPAAQDVLTFFVEGMGYLTYTRMPFGPVESPARFNDFGSRAFGHLESCLQPNSAFARWMDDLNIASSSFEDHLDAVEQLLQACEDCGVTLSPSKTELGADGVKWCGNVIGRDGVTSDPSKVAAIVRWPEPRTPMDVLRFVNTASFLRSRIPDFSALAAPLLKLAAMAEVPDGVGRRRGIRRKALNIVPVNWVWKTQEKQSFCLVKAAVAFAIASTPADFTKHWFVDADAGPDAFGAALLQECPTDPRKRQIIAVASKRCSNAERNQSQFLRELMAIRFALDRFNSYIKGAPIVLTTDCQGLVDLLNSSDLSSTYVRWRESMLSFNIVRVAHRPGARNLVCDALSRPPKEQTDHEPQPVLETWEERYLNGSGASWSEPSDTDLVIDHASAVDSDASRAATTILRRHALQAYDTAPHPSVPAPQHDVRLIACDQAAEDLIQEFHGDPLAPVVEFLLSAKLPDTLQQAAVTRRLARNFFVRQGALFHVTQAKATLLRCITQDAGRSMATEHHEREGHYGRDITLLRLRADGFYFFDMQRIIGEAVLACRTCQEWGAQHRAALMGPIIHPQPLDLLALDFVSFPTLAGGQHSVLAAGEYFSRFLWAEVAEPTGKSVADFLRKFVTIAAVPRRIVTDNGSHFANKEVAAVCEALGIVQSFVPVHAPWVNGLVERSNGLLVAQLRTLCRDAGTNDWASLLPTAVQSINRRVMPAVGYSPQQLLFGLVHFGAYDAHGQLVADDELPPTEDIIEIHQTLVETLRDSVTAERIAQISEATPISNAAIPVGELVMLRNYKPKNKLAPKWLGPYRVALSLPGSAKLETLDGIGIPRRHHVNHLKRFSAALIEEADAA